MNNTLWAAAAANQAEVCRDLLSFGVYGDLSAQINSKGKGDWTALHIAADKGHTDVCIMLLQCADEIDINCLTATFETPLHLASKRGFLDTVQILVNAGANINAQDEFGDTPLHLASRHSFSQVVAWLLGKSPDVTLKNLDKMTAYETAGSKSVTEDFEIYFDYRMIDYKRIMVDETPTEKSAFQHDELDRILVQADKDPRIQRLLVDRMKMRIVDRVRLKMPRHTSESRRSLSQELTAEYIDFIPKKLLGKGSFGEVYLVVKRDTGDLYAMKVLKKKDIIGQELMKYALAERNVLGYISHPFIVHLNWAFQTPEKLVLILDYCPGGDLGKLIEREKRLSEETARIYASEILLAVEELHKNKILYRDLKPENVILDGQGHALLTDFGLSKENAVDSMVSRSFCGSVAYLAPEVLRRQGHQKSVDWYLFGALLYEMLVGTPPYFSRDKNELFRNIKHGKLKLPKKISLEAKDLITKLLERNPRERLGSGPRGTEEIKGHPFFAGMDWEGVYRKELRPPLPLLEKFDKGKAGKKDPEFKLEAVYGDVNFEQDEKRIEGWSFVGGNHD